MAMAKALGAGNPSSVHRLGREGKRVLNEARDAVAALAHARPEEIVFTSGGSEANALALKGVSGRRLIVSAIEHDSVLGNAANAAIIPVLADGRVDLAALETMLGEGKSALVSVMLANNETGVIQDVAEAVRIAHRHGALLHCDAIQAAGKIAIDAAALDVDLMSLSAHKLGGPMGVGALVVRNGVQLEPLIRGGGQERRQRAGTENLPGIAGFGAAAKEAAAGLAAYAAIAALRDERAAAPLRARVRRGRLRRRCAATAQYALHRDALCRSGNAGDRVRSCRGDGQRRLGLFLGQGRAQPCARRDGRHVGACRNRDPHQPRLEHDPSRSRSFGRSLGRALRPHPRERRMTGAIARKGNQRPVYLDYQATTPCDPRVVQAMLPWFTEKFGNPASITHAYGREAETAVEQARAQIASIIKADAREIIFTSGATEANNLAIKGALHFHKQFGKDHIVTLVTEHKCVLESAKAMEARRLPRDLSAGREQRPRRSRAAQRCDRGQDRDRLDHGRA